MIKIMEVIGNFNNYFWNDKLFYNIDLNLETSHHMKVRIPFRDIQVHLKVRVWLSLGKYEGVWNTRWVHLYLEHLSFLGCFRVSWVMLSILEPSSRITITTTTRCRNDKGARTSWASSHNLRYKSMWWIPLSRFKKVEIDFWRWRPLYSFNDAHETIARDQLRFCNLISFGVIFRDFYMLLGDTDVKFQSK